MDKEEFRTARAAWARGLAEKLVSPRVLKALAPESRQRAPEEAALLTLHVGLGHLLGHDSADLAVDGYLSEAAVNDLISRVWRSGDLEPSLIRSIPQSWVAFFCVGRDCELIDVELLVDLRESAVGRWLVENGTRDLDPQLFDDRLEEAVLGLGEIDRQRVLELAGPTSASLDCDGSHIWTVQVLNATRGDDSFADSPATLLELMASFPDDESDIEQLNDLSRARTLQVLDRSMPGAWPERTSGRTPIWVRQVVLQLGARFYNGTTGFVPSWIFVAESEEELRAFQGWTYQPGIGIVEPGEDGVLTLCMRLDFSQSGETSYAWYRYDLTDTVDQIHLRTLLAVGFLRVDAYRVTSDAHLAFEFSVGFPIPAEVSDHCRRLLAGRDPDGTLTVGVAPGRETLEMMSMFDRRNFETIQRCQPALVADPGSSVAASYRRYLDVMHSAAEAISRGGIVDDSLLQEAHESLRAEISRASLSTPLEPISLDILSPHRAYLQFRTTVSEKFLEVFAAWTNALGQPETRRWEFSDTLDIGSLPVEPLAQVEAIRVGLAQVGELLELGVTNVVISLDPATHHLLVHRALLALGFDEASFAHSLSALRSMNPASAPSTAAVFGWPGSGSDYIESVEFELEAVRGLYPPMPDEAGSVDVLHLSGHAETGFAIRDVFLRHSPEALTSAASVLRDFGGQANLVFLAACGTGMAKFASDQLVETPPLDVAFIEAGAHVVVSTAAPVNDIVAGVFSCAFHFHYSRSAETWGAFKLAEEIAKGGDSPGDFAGWMDESWPFWRTALLAALKVAPNDWMLFRLSGCFWTVDR